MPPTQTPNIGPSPILLTLPSPVKALRQRRELAAFRAEQAARIGTGDQAVAFALDGIKDHYDRLQFLKDWQAGDLEDWPDYRPTPRSQAKLGALGFTIRAAAVFGGAFAALLLASVVFAPTEDPLATDPIQILLELVWAGSVLICTLVAWRASGRREEG